MKNSLLLAVLFLVMVAISQAAEEKSTFLDIMKKNLASSDDKAGDVNKILGADTKTQKQKDLLSEAQKMRFVEDSSSGSSSGEDDDDEPTETDLKKSKLFQAKTRDRLQKGRFFYREQDQRQNIEFEPRIGFDPFVSYLGYIRDISLKSYEVVEHKILELKV